MSSDQMGYSHGGKNGTGFQTGSELFNEKNNIEGLIEFLYVEDCGQTADFTPSTQRINSFSHIGLIVPDINATQARLEQYGATILKGAGDVIDPESPAVKAFGFASATAAARRALKGIQGIGFDSFILATDPDGNMLEIQPQFADGI
jgi:lactoylglutathione lyase